jgi:hypothetical protein
MGVLRDIFAGNTAMIDITFVPTAGFADVTAISLRVEDSNKIEHVATAATLSTNKFRGSYNIPDVGPAGVWVFRWESTAGSDVAGEQRFNVVGPSFSTP